MKALSKYRTFSLLLLTLCFPGALPAEASDYRLTPVTPKIRITSYNVCYTKLLRELSEAEHPVVAPNQKRSHDGNLPVSMRSVHAAG